MCVLYGYLSVYPYHISYISLCAIIHTTVKPEVILHTKQYFITPIKIFSGHCVCARFCVQCERGTQK